MRINKYTVLKNVPECPKDSDSPTYLVYAPGNYSNKVYKTASLKTPRAKVKILKDQCSQSTYNNYHNITGQSDNAWLEFPKSSVLNRCALLVFIAKDGKWVLMPEESFSILEVDGYPLMAHQQMYHIPIKTKTRYKDIHMQVFAHNANKKSSNKRINTSTYVMLSLEKFVEASKLVKA